MERDKNRRNVRYLNCRSIAEDESRPRFSTIIKTVLETLCSVDKFGLLSTFRNPGGVNDSYPKGKCNADTKSS